MLARMPVATSNSVTAETETLGGDFSHVEDWIFDLDNTLYEQREGVLKVVESRICRFVQRHCELPEHEAFALQKTYYHRYGNTLAGLMAHHGADPEDYLAYVNDVDVSTLPVDARLKPALERLPGRRFIFTNNCRRYAERVLKRLDIADCFDDVWDIRTVGVAPKPDPAAYAAVVDKCAVNVRRAAMFEDSPANLKPAHELGMKTVYVASPTAAPAGTHDHIHHYTDDLPVFLSSLKVATS